MCRYGCRNQSFTKWCCCRTLNWCKDSGGFGREAEEIGEFANLNAWDMADGYRSSMSYTAAPTLDPTISSSTLAPISVCRPTCLSASPSTTSHLVIQESTDAAQEVSLCVQHAGVPSDLIECTAPYIPGPGKTCVCPAANLCGGKCFDGPAATCGGTCYLASGFTCQSNKPVPNPVNQGSPGRRRSEIPFGRCSFGQELCPVATSSGYECVNTISDMESCTYHISSPVRKLTNRWRLRSLFQRYR
jgi:hypothetical protein